MNKVIPIPSREQVTNLQVSTILSSIATLTPLFHIGNGDWKEGGGMMDKSTQFSVQTTLIKLCNRLDTIADDEDRWGMKSTGELEKHLTALYTEHAKTLKLQQQQLYYLARPHVRHSPSLYRMRDGSYLAILGSLDDIDNAIVGVGGCPEQALEAFDEMFQGRIPSHLQAWMAVREEAITNNLQPPTKEQYDKSQMESSRDRAPDKNEGIGPHDPPDSGDARSDEESGGDQAGPPSQDPDDPIGPYRFD